MERAKEALLADSFASLAGSLFGTTPTSAYIESSAGVANGGRTGLTALTTSSWCNLNFLIPTCKQLSFSSSDYFTSINHHWFIHMESIAKIDWSDITEAFPAFVTIVGIPLTGSINDGIAFGFIFYVVLKLSKNNGKIFTH